jgi:sugar lactone lactonase YvrE
VRASRLPPLTALAFASTLACSSGTGSVLPDGGTRPDAGGDGSTVLPPTDVGCDDAAKLVYVISREGYLYKFDPAVLSFAPVGRVDCFNGGATAFSMAIDRKGIAWILYTDGGLNRVDVHTAKCEPTAFDPGQQGFQQFGMGFSVDVVGEQAETLFASDISGKGLAKIDLKSLVLTKVGPYDGPVRGTAATLTGTGDGRLFGFFASTPARVGEIDKATGHVTLGPELPNVSTGTDWAFAFWGGVFWLFTANEGSGLPMMGRPSKVTRYDPKTGTATDVVANVGFYVTGAGVSTCAPLVQPPPR